MANTIVLSRPLPLRVAAATTLAIIVAWAAVSGGSEGFGTIAYPAIIGLQAAREFLWRLEVSKAGLVERPGIGPTRTLKWNEIEGTIMPNAVWWRINPVLKVANGPNIQMTAGEGIAAVLEIAASRRRPVEGDVSSISLAKSLLPWFVLMALGSLLLGGAVAARSVA